MFLPEANGFGDPALGVRTGAETETVTEARVLVIFDFGPGLS